MTVCIGLISEENKIVLAADRMITANYPPIKFEPDIVKYQRLSKTCVALTADSALAYTELFQDVINKIRHLNNPPISLIVEKVKESFVKLRLKKAEEEVLKPRGLTIEKYYETMRMLPEGLVVAIDKGLMEKEYPLLILLCGVDDTGAHIYRIFDPGHSECFDSLGFNAIGSGELHAVSSFIAKKCNAKTPFERALYCVYEAKRNAEKAPGVGEYLDMLVIDNDDVKIVNPELLKQLSDIYQKNNLEQNFDIKLNLEKQNTKKPK